MSGLERVVARLTPAQREHVIDGLQALVDAALTPPRRKG
jgi:hypothetical protein